MIDLEKLKKLAKAATPGPWEPHDRGPAYDFSPTNVLAIDTEKVSQQPQKVAQRVDYNDAAFIAAANPATIVELVDELESLRQAVSDIGQALLDQMDE